METTLKVRVSKAPPGKAGVLATKESRMKRSLLKKLFGGDDVKMAILIPGDEVAEVEIVREDSGGVANAG